MESARASRGGEMNNHSTHMHISPQHLNSPNDLFRAQHLHTTLNSNPPTNAHTHRTFTMYIVPSYT